MTVDTHFADGVAIVTIGNPPVNLGNATVRRELQQALRQIAEDRLVTGVVLASRRSPR